MQIYEVTIQATVTKTVSVEADNEDDAVELAHEEFSVSSTSNDEKYTQETISVFPLHINEVTT